MFFKRRPATIEWLVAGLGNPGKQYEGTRHNVGFDALDFISKEWDIPVRRSRFDALCGDGEAGGHRVLLLKPQTYMNLSGNSLAKAADYYKIPPERVMVLCDDVALAPGVLRIRLSGSDGGQKGLRSIIAALGDAFPRIRIGVGQKPHPDYDMAKWVLARLAGEDAKQVAARWEDVAGAALLLMDGRASDAMSRYNGEKK